MIRLCIFLFLPFASVLSYPSINKNSDKFELPNEFWSHHFGSDFKDAVHFHLQQSDILNAGNILSKHFPEIENNAHAKRSTYVLHTPQLVGQQNRTLDNFMKVQLLSPGEIEALERGIANKNMYRSPVVVTLPEYGSVRPNSLNHATSPPMMPNTPSLVYQNNPNSLLPSFYQSNQNIWPQNQQYSAYDPKMVYQQLPNLAFEKTMQPSYEKIMMKPFHQPSYQNSIHAPSPEQIWQPDAQENKMETLLQPSLEKPLESSPEQPSFEKQLNGPDSKDKFTEPSNDKTMQPSIDNISPSTDKVQPSTETIQPTSDNVQPSTDTIQPSNEMKNLPFKTIQPPFKKVQATFEKIQAAYPKMRQPAYEEVSSSHDSQSLDKLKKQNPYEGVQHSGFHNNRMMSYDKPTSSDTGRQSLNAEQLDRTFEPKQGSSFDDVRDGKHEYRGEKKTTT